MSAAPDLTGCVLDGRYRLTRLMGEGGMGQVYEAFHDTLDRKLAVKVLRQRYAYDANFRERFLREAKAASRVRHPNVVQILDFGDTPNGSVYFAMEYLEGRDLRTLLYQEGPLPWPRARHMLLQITSALAAAHDRKIIHRDLKPANFFITEARGFTDLVKVLDFGIAKIAADPDENSVAKSLTGTGQVFGTAKYMAPEQAYGSSDDRRVDVYSVGIVAYELLTGQIPFDGATAFEIITRHVNDAPRPPRELIPSIPPAVEAAILKALAKRAEDRHASMEALEQAFGAVPSDVGTRGRMPSGLRANINRRANTPSPALTHPSPGPAPLVVPPSNPPSEMLTELSTLPSPSAGPSASFPPLPSTSGAPLASTTTPGDDSGAGSFTAPVQDHSGVSGSTGPFDARPPPTSSTATDLHNALGTPVGRPGLTRVLLAFGAIAVTALAFFVAVTVLPLGDEDDEPRADAEETIVAKAVVPEPEPEPEPELEPEPVPKEVDEPEASTTTSTTEAPPEPTEPEPEPEVQDEPKPSKARPKPRRPATDSQLESRLVRKMKRKCQALGEGTSATVDILVGSNGKVLSKTVRGATGELRKCLLGEAAKATFTEGTTRTFTLEVTL